MPEVKKLIKDARDIILNEILHAKYPTTILNHSEGKYVYAGSQAKLYQDLESMVGSYADFGTVGNVTMLFQIQDIMPVKIEFKTLDNYISELTVIKNQFNKKFQEKIRKSLDKAISCILEAKCELKKETIVQSCKSAKNLPLDQAKDEMYTLLAWYAHYGLNLTNEVTYEQIRALAESSPELACELIETQWHNLPANFILGVVLHYQNKDEVVLNGKKHRGSFIVEQLVDVIQQKPSLCKKISEVPSVLEESKAIIALYAHLRRHYVSSSDKENVEPVTYAEETCTSEFPEFAPSKKLVMG